MMLITEKFARVNFEVYIFYKLQIEFYFLCLKNSICLKRFKTFV